MTIVCDGSTVHMRMMCKAGTMSSRDRVGGLCHAITTEEVRLEGRLK